MKIVYNYYLVHRVIHCAIVLFESRCIFICAVNCVCIGLLYFMDTQLNRLVKQTFIELVSATSELRNVYVIQFPIIT